MDSALHKALGQRVGTIRRALGLTQEELAERAGIGGSYLARIEGGTRHPTLTVLAAIASSLGTSVATLVEVSDANALDGNGKRMEAFERLRLAVEGLAQEDLDVLVAVAAHLRRIRAPGGLGP